MIDQQSIDETVLHDAIEKARRDMYRSMQSMRKYNTKQLEAAGYKTLGDAYVAIYDNTNRQISKLLKEFELKYT